MNLLKIPLLMALLTMAGCGTFHTFAPDNGRVQINYMGHKSYCTSIPRIYSGVMYDFCEIYGEPNNEGTDTPKHLFAFDFMCSAVLDTVILPYTIFRQINDGNIRVN